MGMGCVCYGCERFFPISKWVVRGRILRESKCCLVSKGITGANKNNYRLRAEEVKVHYQTIFTYLERGLVKNRNKNQAFGSQSSLYKIIYLLCKCEIFKETILC